MFPRTSIFFICLFSLCSTMPLVAESREFFELMRKSQNLLAAAKPIEAEADLIKWEKERPEIRKNPMFCYQRFYVALEGLGDRDTARLMLRRLDLLVASGELSATSPIYRSVTQSWNKALFYADSELPRQAHQIMHTRLALTAKQP